MAGKDGGSGEGGRGVVECGSETARRRAVAGMCVAGMAYYTAWKSWAFVGKEIMAELEVDKAALGSLSSALILAYAASKFVVAPLADTVDVRLMLAGGLAASALVALAFASVSSLPLMVLLWAGNGLLNGAWWPPCGKLLIFWFPPDQRGTWWGVVSTTRPLAGALLAFIVPPLAATYGWRMAIAIPSVVSLLAAGLVLAWTAPPPATAGEQSAASPVKVTAKKAAVKEAVSGNASSVSALLTNPSMWWLNLACAFCLAVKVALGDWLVMWLEEKRGFDKASAAALIFWLEVGYGSGSLTCGWISDTFCGGSRAKVNLWAQVVASAALGWLFYGPLPAPQLSLPAVVFVFGAAINMPATLIGMVASEKVTPSLAATACGIVGGVGYLGASLCGFPLGALVQAYGWPMAETLLVTFSVGAAIAMVPLIGDAPVPAHVE
ncbi:regulatory protein UhpC [Thecamonas trahens ATCC 50062]|uniref:Regulatory protein UhpC n=1 Tax=Thecamonas trahens ATCC 50062 TaxID=461836 RepID=A0A0L0DH76_THETB|nr:regulatory protein UhpC [Thecamonas trahens ATCC 50062]KNC51704.1 regulatory protein UhpC [Thecamonas trahens ATCC 50062]|eukprot:XP_013755833.1 regulatory protein UhpC [Thecamonas trahens ATCC 50062]